MCEMQSFLLIIPSTIAISVLGDEHSSKRRSHDLMIGVSRGEPVKPGLWTLDWTSGLDPGPQYGLRQATDKASCRRFSRSGLEAEARTDIDTTLAAQEHAQHTHTKLQHIKYYMQKH